MGYILNLCNLITVTYVNTILLLKLQMQCLKKKIYFCASVCPLINHQRMRAKTTFRYNERLPIIFQNVALDMF